MAKKSKVIQLSATAIAAFKRCPTLFKAKYIAGLRPVEDTDSQRTGTDWGSLLEVAETKIGDKCPRCAPKDFDYSDDCLVCDGTCTVKYDAMSIIEVLLNEAYPNAHEDENQATTKTKLLMSIAAYMWHWDVTNPEYEVLATEVPFEFKVVNPETGQPCRDSLVRGKLDRLIRIKSTGALGVLESKSTVSDIDDGSGYWDHMTLDTQTLLYPYAMYRMQKTGELEKYGIQKDDPIATTVLYDVWRKPGIKMKKLSMADSKKIVTEGTYCGDGVEVWGLEVSQDGKKKVLEGLDPTIDGVPVTLIPNAAGNDNAIYENEALYGIRVFSDITADPDKYFARREISRTVNDMVAFEGQLYSIYKVILDLRRTGHWWQDERQCKPKGTYQCPMIAYCWHGETISSDNVLDGFECIWEKDPDA